MAANYLRVGAHRLVLAGVLEDPTVRHRYRQAVGVPLRVARLRANLALIHQRLRGRHVGQHAALDWHLRRCGELHDILESVAVEDFILDIGELSIEQTADALITSASWDPTFSS